MIYIKNRLGTKKRDKAFLGALVGAVTSIGSALISSNSAKKQRRQQERADEYNRMVQEAANDTAAYNSAMNYQDDYNKMFQTQVRLGTKKNKLYNNRIVITDGGDAQQVSNDTFLLRGGSHEDVNETGQTGIGINVGGNQIEAEGGEVAQTRNGSLRIFSAQPILGNGMSPAQAILRGYNKDKVFAAQQRFKRNNNLNDDGSKAQYGTQTKQVNKVPKKRIHVNEDGTLTDTLNGDNYHTLATNGEDVVITGKANNWKEAGKHDTSSYFDPMGAITFASAAGAPILNFTPSNIVGSIREAKNYNSFMNSFMNNDNSGFFTKDYADKHPYISFLGNIVGDTVAGGLGYKTAQTAYRLRPSNVRKHIFENISPISYEQPFTRLRTAIKSALSGQEADIDNPEWFNKANAELLKDYGDNTNYYLQARFDAWRKYLGLPQKYNTFTPNKRHKGTFTDIKGISQLKTIPNQVVEEQQKDFVNSVGGNIGVPEIYVFPDKGYKNATYGITTTNDAFDLHPFSRKDDTVFNRYFRPTYNNTVGKAINKTAKILRHKGGYYAYDNNAINYAINNGYDDMFDITDFPNKSKIKRIVGDKLINAANKLDDYSYLFSDKGVGKPLNKLSNKLGKIEASTFIPGAKPFTVSYDIPWTKDYKMLKARTYKGFNKDNNIPQSVKQFMIDNSDLDYDVKLRLGGRSKLAKGGWTKPVYSTVDYRGSKRVRQYIAKAEGSDFAKQNKQFKGDAVGTKELELRNFMGKAYQYLNEGQRDALLSYYYNLKPNTFINQYKGLRDRLINAQTEQEYNDTINAMKNSINVGWNNKKLPGLRNRRAVERSWFGYVNPTAQQTVNDKINQIETVPVDNTMVQKPIVVDIPQQEVHVPAGVIPVQNTEPNLFNGDIKQNIIDMGSQFKGKYSCGGSARKRSIASRPVKGMYRCGGTARPKKALGTNWSDIQNDLNGSGGVIPRQPNNNFNVQVPYAITSSTPTIQYKATYSPSIDSRISTKVGSLKSGVAKTSEPSGLKLDTGSYISLGADLLGALGSTFINSKSANKTYIPKAPIRLQPSKLKTIYNVNPQIASIERQRGNMRDEIMRNTSSSAAALQRLTDINNATVDSENQLYQLKENQETQMLNQDSLNQQQVAEKNVEAQNQYNYYVANLRNQQQQAKANALSTGLIGVTNAINNFVGQGRQNYDDEQAMLMGIAASDYATPSRLIDLGVNLSPSSLAGIYRSVNNTPNPGNAPKPEDYSSTTEYSIAKNAYDRSLKAYNNRNAYANLVKSRMSLRQRRRYGIN